MWSCSTTAGLGIKRKPYAGRRMLSRSFSLYRVPNSIRSNGSGVTSKTNSPLSLSQLSKSYQMLCALLSKPIPRLPCNP